MGPTSTSTADAANPNSSSPSLQLAPPDSPNLQPDQQPPPQQQQRRRSTFRIKQRLASWHAPDLHRVFSNTPDPDPADGQSNDDAKMPSLKSPNGNFNQKIKNFFRINSDAKSHHGAEKGLDLKNNESRSNGFRNTKFFSVGRLRSTTNNSDGNPLDEAMSPTAHANPYYALQGQPGLRHNNEGSIPPSPRDTSNFKTNGPDELKAQPTSATKEELARKLRRVASAPNAHGLFSKGKGSGERPATAELGKEPLVQNSNSTTLGLVDKTGNVDPGAAVMPDKDGLGDLPPPGRSPLAFRRTYSSNSIKVRTVEVGPSSFDKIKLIGKGDVGKVYLVREKKSSRLYAMKGINASPTPLLPSSLLLRAEPPRPRESC